MLDAQDLSNIDKGQIVMARQSLKRHGLRICPGQQCWEFTNSGPRRDKPQTSDRVLGTQGSSMQMGNEFYPV